VETVKIMELREDLDAQAVRCGDAISASLSDTVPLWARDATVAHLARSLRAVEGHLATVHLERGQAALVALAYARPAPRARPRIRINPLRAAVTALAVPFVAALFAVNPPWVLTSTVEPPAPDPLIAPPAESRVVPTVPPPHASPGREPTPPSRTRDRPRDPLTDLVPRVSMPRIVRQVPARLPDMPAAAEMPSMPPSPPIASRPSHPAGRPGREPHSIPWPPSAPAATWGPWS
jgi:hypothetical protein